jgi:hypothetical protein
LNGRGEWP